MPSHVTGTPPGASFDEAYQRSLEQIAGEVVQMVRDGIGYARREAASDAA